MKPERSKEERMLRDLLHLSRENNKILRGIRQSNRISAFIKVVYWAAILSGLYYGYQVLQPILEGFQNTLNDVSNGLDSVNSAAESLNSINLPF